MKKIKLFGALLLLLPGIASCGALDSFVTEEDTSGFANLDSNIEDKPSETKKDDSKEEPKEEPKENPQEESSETEEPKIPDNPQQELYTVVWHNGNSILERDENVVKGSTPEYNGNTPTKTASNKIYTFIGWNTDPNATVALNSLPKVNSNLDFYAIFSSKDAVSKDTLKNDTRKLTAQGDGYTYLDYSLEVKYKSWSELISGGYISVGGDTLSNINLDSLGKGVFQIPEDSNLILSSSTETNLFANCELIDGLNIPAVFASATLMSIARGCTSLRTVEFLEPKSGSTNKITAVGSYAFNNCTSLETVKFSNPNITTINLWAFQNCKNLKSVTLPSKLNLIESLAFENTLALEEINLPSSVTAINKNAFSSSGIKKLTVNSYVEVAECAFYGSDLESVVFNGSSAKLKLSGKEIFRKCEKLTSFDFSKMEYTSTNNYYLFAETGFTSIDFSQASCSGIPGFAFYGCTKLTTVKLNSYIRQIDDYAFKNCTNLTTINDIYSNMFNLNTGCFEGCSKLQTLNYIGGTSFSNLLNLGDDAFIGTNFSTIDINVSTMDTSTSAFENMTNLTTATLTIRDATFLPYNLFKGCSKLTTLNLNVKYLNKLVDTSSKTDTNSFSIGTKMTHRAFQDCNSLTTINFSGTVDQMMNYYVRHLTGAQLYETVLDFRENTKLKIVCKKGCVKTSQTSSFTITSSNFASVCKTFGYTL